MAKNKTTLICLLVMNLANATIALQLCAEGDESCMAETESEEQVALQVSVKSTDVKVDARSFHTPNPRWVIDVNMLDLQNPEKTINGVPVLKGNRAGDKWVLVMKSGARESTLDKVCSDAKPGQCHKLGHPDDGGLAMVEIDATDDEIRAVLDKDAAEVAFMEPDGQTFADPDVEDSVRDEVVPQDPDAASQFAAAAASSPSWGLDTVGAPHRRTQGSGVHVYVFDTGIRTTHKDFGGRAIRTIDVTSSKVVECGTSDSGCALDRQGHGTHCAGTVGGTHYGVAPQSTLHAVKVLSDRGSGYWSWSIAAMDWVQRRRKRPAVVSMSLGGSGTSQSMKIAVDKATAAGVTVVVAAGNSNNDACRYSPAFVPNAVTVGSTTSSDRRSGFSNYGRCVDIFAPGSRITSLSHSSDTVSATKSGTSMACPHVSGGAALLLETHTGWKMTDIVKSMTATGKKNAIGDVKSGSPNLLLIVGTPGGAPAPAPCVKPTPAPTPAPA